MKKLSILIATTPDRAHDFSRLLDEFQRQIGTKYVPLGIRRPDIFDPANILEDNQEGCYVSTIGSSIFTIGSETVEIIAIRDDKKMSIGTKRQKLLELSTGEWIVFFDDDDLPMYNYVDLILNAIEQPGIDCIGIRGFMTTNGENKQTWCHRLGRVWCEKQEGFDYIRPIIHFNPVKRELALAAGFKDMRYGEDRDYSDRLNLLLTKEHFIDEDLFHYRYSNKVQHNQKYGIK